MKYLLILVLAILNLINIPLGMLFVKVQKWYLPMWREDRVLYYAFAPFYWFLVILSFIFSWPCEKLSKLVH